jgi:hypothetical protein
MLGLPLFPFFAIIVVSFLYREDLGVRALIIYASLWSAAFAIVIVARLSPGIFGAAECAIAIAMLIHVRANPDIPLR